MPSSGTFASKRFLRREGLQKKLRRAGDFPLTLVCAPAGYGKTTLVRSALKTLLPPKVWLELDGRLAQPSRFYLHVMAACRKVRPEFCQKFTLDDQSALWPEPEVLLSGILADLEACHDPLILVFDDTVGEVSGPAAPELGRFLVQLPAHVHAVLLCREKPALNLNRWRLRGELLDIAAEELALSSEETRDFFRGALGIELEEDDLSVVHSRCEGWVAGLQLLVMRLEREPDPLEALRRLGGGHALLFEYLMEEVLHGLPDAQREFLLDTALLPRLHPDLCDAVTGRTDSGPLLAALLERNCFLVREEDGAPWFRYHRLFAEGLQGLLRQWKPNHTQTLHRRAARWHLAYGQVEPAMEHALAARDADLLDELAEKTLENIFRNSDFVTLHRYAALIPDELAEGRKFLPLFMAWAFFHMGREKAGERLLEQSHQALKSRFGFSEADEETSSSRAALAHGFYLRGILLRLRGDLDHSIQILHRAVALAPASRPFLLASLKVQLGIGIFLAGRLGEASAVLLDAMDLAEATSHHLAFYGAGYTYAELLLLQGNPDRIQRHLTRMFAYEALSSAHAGSASGYAHIARARALLQQGEDAQAQAHIERGITLGKRGGNIRILNYGYAALAYLLAAKGQAADARAYFDLAEDFGRRNRMNWGVDLDDLEAARVRLDFSAQGFGSAEAWYARQRPLLRQYSLMRWDACRTALRFLIGAGRAAEGHALALYWQSHLTRLGLSTARAEISLALALIEVQRNRRAPALAFFEEALREARASESIAVFTGWCGQEELTLNLSREWRAPHKTAGAVISGDSGAPLDAGLVAFAVRLESLAALQHAPAGTPKQEEANSLLLSDRELEVLRAMRDGKSNKEIAVTLFVASSTVKTHLKHIFTKLQVSNRTRAVTLAEESGLLR
jgi:LuxR family maltose regulon positive regulatory protein